MKKEIKGDEIVYSLTQAEWRQFLQPNPKPESLGIEYSLMQDSSWEVSINSSEKHTIMNFEAATFLAGISTELRTK